MGRLEEAQSRVRQIRGPIKQPIKPFCLKTSDRFAQMVKNTYRVLLTRGMKGCYVHFMDKNTENLFRGRMEHMWTGKINMHSNPGAPARI